MVPALRKLQRIGLWIRNLPIYSDAWGERTKLRLGIDNDTRSNAWHGMIDNLIRKNQQVRQFLLDYDKALGDKYSHLFRLGLPRENARVSPTIHVYDFVGSRHDGNSLAKPHDHGHITSPLRAEEGIISAFA
jgi:hypothetical protein